MNIKHYILTYKWPLVAVFVVACGAYYYFYVYKANSTTAVASYYVVDTATIGAVSSGIQTTGKIIAEQKLDLNVYKRLNRIDVVKVVNGSHVEKGKVLISFDKSASLVDVESSRVAIANAQLSLQNEIVNASDPNTKARTLENQIEGYKKAISDARHAIDTAYLDFLNADIEIVPHKGDYTRLVSTTYPTLSGRYIGHDVGQYVIEVYRSNATSHYSFRLSGLETGSYTVYFGRALDLGTHGLTITFPTSLTYGTWVVDVPNVDIASYDETKKDYEQTVADLEEKIKTAEVNLKNAEQDLEDLQATDSTAYRNLNVEQASLAVSEASQKLSQNYDAIRERDIIAPFSGTIQDMENVVVGATPTGGTSDTISLGTLISDTFLTTFTLSATDVAKVSLGQKVKVTATSFASQPVFEGTVIEISSLPSAEGVAQYEVLAKLNYDRTNAKVMLREGVLADIEIVEEEKETALRIPVSALSYENGKPAVKVIDSLTDVQKAEIAKTGIIKTDGVAIPTYSAPVELGIQGKYYVEVTKGLDEGTYILTTASATAATDAVVNQAGFRPGGGGDNGNSTRTQEASTQNRTN